MKKKLRDGVFAISFLMSGEIADLKQIIERRGPDEGIESKIASLTSYRDMLKEALKK